MNPIFIQPLSHFHPPLHPIIYPLKNQWKMTEWLNHWINESMNEWKGGVTEWLDGWMDAGFLEWDGMSYISLRAGNQPNKSTKNNKHYKKIQSTFQAATFRQLGPKVGQPLGCLQVPLPIESPWGFRKPAPQWSPCGSHQHFHHNEVPHHLDRVFQKCRHHSELRYLEADWFSIWHQNPRKYCQYLQHPPPPNSWGQIATGQSVLHVHSQQGHHWSVEETKVSLVKVRHKNVGLC